MRTATEIHAQLITAGIDRYVIAWDDFHGEDSCIRGFVDLSVLDTLRQDPRCTEGIWSFLHEKDVGEPRTEFRFDRSVLAPDTSLQFVVNTDSGRFYADLDRFNTQDVVNIVGHLGVDVLWSKVKGWFRRKRGDGGNGLPG